jgi:hypothetical protein
VDRVNDHNHEWFKLIDLASFGVVVGTIAGALPSIAALMTIIWTAFRIYETDTVQRWLNRRNGGK